MCVILELRSCEPNSPIKLANPNDGRQIQRAVMTEGEVRHLGINPNAWLWEEVERRDTWDDGLSCVQSLLNTDDKASSAYIVSDDNRES
jgi:hypothetical protein